MERVMRHYRGAMLILLVLLAAGAAAAQHSSPSAPPRARAAERAKHLNELLGLTGEQSARVLAILTRQDARAAEDHAATGGNRRAEAKALRTRVAASDREIEALLTPDQAKKYASYKKARRNELDRRKRPRGAEYE